MKTMLNKLMDETVMLSPLSFPVLIAPTWFNRIGDEFKKLNEMYGINYKFESYDSFLKQMINLDKYSDKLNGNKVSEVDTPNLVPLEGESAEEPSF